MIRPATHADIHKMLPLGEAMHAESRYASMPWDTRKVGHLIAHLIDSDDGLALVAEREGVVVGGFIGSAVEHYFSTAKVAGDLALFVTPDKRGGVLGARLLKAYIAWARTRDVADEWIQAGITTGVNLAASTRLFQSVGFAPVGTLFQFQGASHVHGR